MKTSNINPAGVRASDAMTGRVSPKRAGSNGPKVSDPAGNDVTAPEVVFIGATVTGEDGDVAYVNINGTGNSVINNSGITLNYGDVVVRQSDGSVTTTTTAQDTRPVGIVQRGNPDGSYVDVVFAGDVGQVNTTGTVLEGDCLETSTTAGKAQSSGTVRRTGSFGQALGDGPDPAAVLFGATDVVTSSATSGDGLVPYFLPAGETYTVPENRQALFADTIEVEGTLEVDGELIEVDPLTVATASGLYQPLDSDLTAIAALSTTSFGRGLLALADAAALRTSGGLSTGDSPQFTAVNLGHASDTTVDRLSAGDIEVEGNRIFRVGGADVPVADGGTGASSASAARTNLGAAASGAVTGGDLTMGTSKLLGRSTASTGAVEEITPGTGLTLAAGVLTAAGALTVEEVDGSPTDAAITKIIFPNDSLSIASHIATVRQVPYGFIGAKAVRTTNQTISHNTETAISFDSEASGGYDSDAFHDNSTNPTRFTVPAGLGGKYRFSGGVGWLAGTAAKDYWLGVRVDGTTTVARQGQNLNAATDLPQQISVDLDLAAGQYVELTVYQNQGGNQTVYANGTYPCWAAIHKLDAGRVGSGVGCSALHNATQSLTSGVEASLSMAAADVYDTDGFHDPSTNNTRMTIPAGMAGKYLLVGGTGFAANGTGVRVLSFRKNGTTAVGQAHIFPGTAAAYISPVITEIADLAAGDYIELRASQDSGGALNASSGAVTTLQIMRLDSIPTGEAAWTSWSPIIKAGATTCTWSGTAKYLKVGKIVHFYIRAAFTSGASAGNITITGQPADLQESALSSGSTSANRVIGGGIWQDEGVAWYHVDVYPGSATSWSLKKYNDFSDLNVAIGTSPQDSFSVQGFIELP